MADLTGSVIAVGSVSELADILANMTPEQLQNVTLDPALYEALSQTIEPHPQPQNYEAGIGQLDSSQASNDSLKVLSSTVTNQNNETLNAAISSNIPMNSEIITTNTFPNVNLITTETNAPAQVVNQGIFNSNNVTLLEGNSINNISTQNARVQPETIPFEIDDIITPRPKLNANIPVLANTGIGVQGTQVSILNQTQLPATQIPILGSPAHLSQVVGNTTQLPQAVETVAISAPNIIAPNISYDIATSNVKIPSNEPLFLANVTLAPQTLTNLNSTTNPIGLSSLINIPTCVQILQTTPAQVVNQSATIQGILPGQAASLIITPTIMSQVQPTASIQALQIPNTTIIPNTSTVTISSNSPNNNANFIINPVSNNQAIATLQNINFNQNINNNLIPNSFNVASVINSVDLSNTVQSTVNNFITQPLSNAVVQPVSINITETQHQPINMPLANPSEKITQQFDQPTTQQLSSNNLNISSAAQPTILSDNNGAIIANVMPNEIPVQQLIDAGLITVEQVASLIQNNQEVANVNIKQHAAVNADSFVKPSLVKVSTNTKSDVNLKQQGTIPNRNNKINSIQSNQSKTSEQSKIVEKSNDLIKTTLSSVTQDVKAFIKEREDLFKTSDKVVHVNMPEKCIDKSQSETNQVKVSVKPKSIQQVQPGVFKVTLAKVESKDTVNKSSVFVNSFSATNKAPIKLQKPNRIVEKVIVNKVSSLKNNAKSDTTITSGVRKTDISPNVTPNKVIKIGENLNKKVEFSTKSSSPMFLKTAATSSAMSSSMTATSSGTPLNKNLYAGERIIRSADKKVYVVKKISLKDKIPKGAIVLPKGIDIEAFQKKLGSGNINFSVSETIKNKIPSQQNRNTTVKSSSVNLECREKTMTSPSDDTFKKMTFSRSFKKTAQPASESDNPSKKEGLSKEENELLNIRKAIKSSTQVEEGEKNMRNLAKLEIEKQLKRFAQKLQPSIEKHKAMQSKIKPKEKNHDTVNLKRKTNEHSADDSVQHQKKSKIPKDSKTDRNKDVMEIDSSDNDNKSSEERSRKRTHPKKYEDFVLSKSVKKKKVDKKKKFFFPSNSESAESDISQPKPDDNKSSHNDQNIEKDTSYTDRNINDIFTDIDSHAKVVDEDIKDKSKISSTKQNEGNKEADIEDKPVDSNVIKYDIKKVSSDAENKSCTNEVIVTENAEVDKKSTNNGNNDTIENENESSDSDNDDDTKNDLKTDQNKEIESTNNTNKKTTNNKKNNKRKKKKKPNIIIEPEVLPAHLKAKPKPKAESMVIDLSKVKLKTTYSELSFQLNDVISYKAYKHLKRSSSACTLCNKPGKIGNLDILFGAYKVKVENKLSKNDSQEVARSDKENSSDNIIMDVWFHRDCAIWTSTISLGNQTLMGVGDALEAGGKTKCCSCSQYGATLECCVKQCRDGYHYVCAKQRGCTFLLENFTITCPKHKT